MQLQSIVYVIEGGSMAEQQDREHTDVQHGATGRPVIADVTGDGRVEVLVVGGDGVLRVVGQR